MKRFLIGMFLAGFAFSLILGCTAKESGEDMTKEPAGTKQAEAMDTTKMDSAMTMVKDTVKAMADSTMKKKDTAAAKKTGK